VTDAHRIQPGLEDRGQGHVHLFGKHKVDGNAFEPLPAGREGATLQEESTQLYAIFVDTVARNRNLDAAAVRATEALTYTADQAIEIGLADRRSARSTPHWPNSRPMSPILKKEMRP
jgi:ClpP class serine protease